MSGARRLGGSGSSREVMLKLKGGRAYCDVYAEKRSTLSKRAFLSIRLNPGIFDQECGLKRVEQVPPRYHNHSKRDKITDQQASIITTQCPPES